MDTFFNDYVGAALACESIVWVTEDNVKGHCPLGFHITCDDGTPLLACV